jgi:hypothetical protein
VTLRGAGKGQDPFGVVILTVEVRGVQLASIGPHAALAVTDDRAVLPAVPHALNDVDELVCPRVPVGVVGMEGLTEVARGQRRDGGDDVPAGPASAEMIHRREPAGELPRLAVSGRTGPDQPDAAGDCGQSRQHRDRVELRLRQVGGPVFGDGDVVGQKDRIHQATFGDPRPPARAPARSRRYTRPSPRSSSVRRSCSFRLLPAGPPRRPRPRVVRRACR